MTDRIMEMLSENYGRYMNETFCRQMCEETELLLENERYRKPIKEWLNGFTKVSEVTVPKNDGGFWSLNDIASRLDPKLPNVPAASFLLRLTEDYPFTMSTILSNAEKECDADYRFTDDENLICTSAILNEESGRWMFLAEDSIPENFRVFQLWQVLLNLAVIAPLISYEHLPGTSIELWNDGFYHVIAPKV